MDDLKGTKLLRMKNGHLRDCSHLIEAKKISKSPPKSGEKERRRRLRQQALLNAKLNPQDPPPLNIEV